jgi:hypothetical protein
MPGARYADDPSLNDDDVIVDALYDWTNDTLSVQFFNRQTKVYTVQLRIVGLNPYHRDTFALVCRNVTRLTCEPVDSLRNFSVFGSVDHSCPIK